MPGLLAVVLICAIGTPREDCTRATALDVMAQPASTPFACMMGGMMRSAHAAEPGQGTYTLIRCERRP